MEIKREWDLEEWNGEFWIPALTISDLLWLQETIRIYRERHGGRLRLVQIITTQEILWEDPQEG